MEQWRLDHMNRWIEAQFGPLERDAARKLMLDTWNEDPEFWSELSWPELCDASGAWMI